MEILIYSVFELNNNQQMWKYGLFFLNLDKAILDSGYIHIYFVIMLKESSRGFPQWLDEL